jgi:hypothetical protein
MISILLILMTLVHPESPVQKASGPQIVAVRDGTQAGLTRFCLWLRWIQAPRLTQEILQIVSYSDHVVAQVRVTNRSEHRFEFDDLAAALSHVSNACTLRDRGCN